MDDRVIDPGTAKRTTAFCADVRLLGPALPASFLTAVRDMPVAGDGPAPLDATDSRSTAGFTTSSSLFDNRDQPVTEQTSRILRQLN